MSKRTRPKRFKTDAPQLSDATLARIRAAAHRFVLAGGSIYPHQHDDGRADYIGNVVEMNRDKSAAVFDDLLEATVTDYGARQRLYDAAWGAIAAHADAGFLFGALVGLEVAALVIGQPVPVSKKGGAR